MICSGRWSRTNFVICHAISMNSLACCSVTGATPSVATPPWAKLFRAFRSDWYDSHRLLSVVSDCEPSISSNFENCSSGPGLLDLCFRLFIQVQSGELFRATAASASNVDAMNTSRDVAVRTRLAPTFGRTTNASDSKVLQSGAANEGSSCRKLVHISGVIALSLTAGAKLRRCVVR